MDAYARAGDAAGAQAVLRELRRSGQEANNSLFQLNYMM